MKGLTVFQKCLICCAVVVLWGGLLMRPAVTPARVKDTLIGPPAPAGLSNSEGWVAMPAGARPAYIGIHGGTVPVSLLTSSDGQSMVTFVGRTGNDFLRVLHKTDIRRPALPGEDAHRVAPESNATVLMADTAIGNVPVFYCTGKSFARMDLAQDQWLPFGLSEKPLLLEGQAGKPVRMAAQDKDKKFRRVLWQQRLQRPVLAKQ